MKTARRLTVFSFASLVVILTLSQTLPQSSAPLLQDDAAKVVLEAPSTACVGELVRLNASGSVADSLKWILVPESADFEVYAEGRRAIFSARKPGKVMFILAVAKGGTVDVVTYTITIGGDTPVDPDDPPASNDVIDTVAKLSAALPKAEKLKLAENFDRVAGMGLTDASVWIYETSKSNRALLGPKVAEFEPFFKDLGDFLGTLVEQGKLETPEDHVKVWKDIAAGLRKG